MLDIRHRRKVKCGKCKKEKYCYQVEIQIDVYRNKTIATKAYDWCCLGCIRKFEKSIESFERHTTPPADWLLEDRIEKDVIKDLEAKDDK